MPKDANDLLREEGEDGLRDRFDRANRVEGKAGKAEPAHDWRADTFTAAELQEMQFPPPKWVVPGLMPEGLTLYAGKPKIGKSFMALEIAEAIAAGKTCLGDREPEVGDVLYAAMEDNRRRLQRRLDKLLPTFNGKWSKRLTLKTTWRRVNEGGIDDIRAWAQSVEKPRLVILDTLAKVKPKGQQSYDLDYEALEGLRSLANELDISILVLHHLRKMDAEDPFDTVSGTLGLNGAADTIIVITRNGQGTTLHVTGRDIEDAEHAVSFDKATCRWNILGNAEDVHRSEERGKILTVLEIADEPMSPEKIAGAASMKRGNVDRLLGKMVRDGQVIKAAHGLYCHPNHAQVATPGKNGTKVRKAEDNPVSYRHTDHTAPSNDDDIDALNSDVSGPALRRDGPLEGADDEKVVALPGQNDPQPPQPRRLMRWGGQSLKKNGGPT